MTDDNVRHLAQRVDFNIDELERDEKPPFSFVLAGQRVEMTDPSNIDVKDLLTIEHPANFLKYALSDEAKKVLAENELPGWKFNKLIEAYLKYYGLDPARMGKDWLSS